MSQSLARRVVITGLGVVSPLGNSQESLWAALQAGRSGVGPLTRLPADALPTKFAAEARDFTADIDNFGPLEKMTQRNIKKGLKVMCREIQMGVAAAQLALHDSGLDASRRDPERTGVSFGSDYILTGPEEFTDGVSNCMNDRDQFEFSRWADDGLPKVDPLWLLKFLPNMPASHIAIYNDLRGPSNSITAREASSNLAIGEAFCTIAAGRADAIVAGATGTRIHPLRTLHVILQEEVARGDGDPATMSRPFDLNRSGLVMGEGAGAVLLEELVHARARDAKIFGEVIGYGSSAVADKNSVAGLRTAIVNVLRQALRTAGLSPGDVGHIHAHGLSTRHCDAAEARAIQDVFGDRREPVPVTAAKSYFGNLGAGSGTVELIASLLALKHGRLFPMLNYTTPDPDCPIRAARSGVDAPGECVVNINVTPQGQASAIAVRTYRE